jgi:hypothetical protein
MQRFSAVTDPCHQAAGGGARRRSYRRERPQAQLIELGERTHPLMKQIYDSALGTRSLAASIKTGELGSLRLALSHTIEFDPLIPHVKELKRLFVRLELKLLRGTTTEVLDLLKNAEVEHLPPISRSNRSVSIAGPCSTRAFASSSTAGTDWHPDRRSPTWGGADSAIPIQRARKADENAAQQSRYGATKSTRRATSSCFSKQGSALQSSLGALRYPQRSPARRSAGSISGAPSTFTRQLAASAPHPSPRFSRCCAPQTGHSAKIEPQFFSAASRSSTAMRFR